MIDTRFVKGLGALAFQLHDFCLSRGFWEHETTVVRDPVLGDVEARVPNPSIVFEKLALIHSEVSEALEKVRANDADGEGLEIADILIRTLDYAEHRGIDVEQVITRKIGIIEARAAIGADGLWRSRS